MFSEELQRKLVPPTPAIYSKRPGESNREFRKRIRAEQKEQSRERERVS